MKLSDFRVLVNQALQNTTVQILTKVYLDAIELDLHYFKNYPNFRMAVVKSIERNYWCNVPEFRHACQLLASHIQKIYELPDITDSFKEHPNDIEIYRYLLDIENEDLETIYSSSISDVSSETLSESGSIDEDALR